MNAQINATLTTEHPRFYTVDTASDLAAELRKIPSFLHQMEGDSYGGNFGRAVIEAYRSGQSLAGFIEQAAQDYVSDLASRKGCSLATVRRDWL